MLTSEALDCYRKAGRIVSKVRRLVPQIVKEGMHVLDLCERVEGAINDLGGKPAFPCNVGINEVAAHYTSPPNDSSVIPSGAVVKIDFGAEVEGYIADSAITISFTPEYEPMTLAAEEALKSAIEGLRPRIRVSEIGALIHKTIVERGYKPISNLTGHKVDRYIIHTGKAIPNVPSINGSRIETGEVYAIEPFVTSQSAAGSVRDLDKAFIYRAHREKGVRTEEAKKLLAYIKRNHRTLPFSTRWLRKASPIQRLDDVFLELLSSKCVIAYPVLVEATGKPVAQAEHTVAIIEDGCEVLTV